MDHFRYVNDGLHAEGVPLCEVARAFGTPTYVYAQATLLRHVQVLQRAVHGMQNLICYAVKANGNLAILQLLGRAGCGFDAVSGGELERIRRAGGAMQQSILSGVGKTDPEIRLALDLGVLYLSVESQAEMLAIGTVARQRNQPACICLRINPDVDAKTHPYISTGLIDNKFGVPTADVPALVQLARQHPFLRLVGLSCHIGSQITTLAPFQDAARKLAAQVAAVAASGTPLSYVGMGGGLGIPYHDEAPPDPASYGAALQQILAPLNRCLVLEPGRMLVGNAGLLLTQVVRIKRHGTRTFVIVDAGMNDLLRPALYQARHQIALVQAPRRGESQVVDVVGPVCESADTFAKGISMPPLQPGDLLGMRSAGAYGAVMASNYNGRARAAEILCTGSRMVQIGRREQPNELWRLEACLPESPEASVP